MSYSSGSRERKVRDEEAVVVDQVLRGGALDFVEADECSRRCPRRVGGLHNSSEIEALTVGAVFERHGDRGAGHEGGGIGERALVDGEAVVCIGLEAIGRELVGSVDVGTEGAGRILNGRVGVAK